jgi:hypothetical protein
MNSVSENHAEDACKNVRKINPSLESIVLV